MEAVSDLKVVVKKNNEENDFEKNDGSDPVVYQLVRVEGDGTLVPATEDEVLQFEHLLHDEKSDLLSIEDVGHVEEFFTNGLLPPKKSDLEAGFSQSETTDIHSEKLDAGLEEGRSQLLDESLDLTSKCIFMDGQPPKELNTEQVPNNILQQDNASTETTKSTLLNDSCSAEKEKADACSISGNETAATGTSVSGTSSSMPDFSLLKGEICLDNLTIRELQEAFRATFGRQTTVKDKLWLKRRITMGLTNSCDVPSSSFVIKDHKIIRKDAKEEIPTTEGICKVELEVSSLLGDQVIDPGNDRDSPSSSYYQSEDQQGSSKRLRRTSSMEYDTRKETLLDEQCATKRMRKPTKRYIEELSDIEARDSSGKNSSSTKKPGHDQALLKRATPFREIGSWSRTFPTRKDTFGGFSVQVPYVSRMRRGRPRQNFISFLDRNRCVESSKVPTAIGITFQKDGEKRSHIRKAGSIVGRVPPLKHVNKKEECTETIDNSKELENVQMPEEHDYGNADAQPKIKLGGKRKHHRAWTLCEVLKLVEGVARYGAGRWSEIRRLAFASYSYRTSVDLKDKWRNLIRASLAQLPMEKDGGCPRKSASTLPIPPSILLRVRELAEMHSQTGDFTMPIKFSGHSGKVVQGRGTGFL